MTLKNYTSGIDAGITVARIEQLLVSAGADGIQKLYKNGKISSLIFKIQFSPSESPIAIRLPANAEACLELFWKEYIKSSRRGRKSKDDFLEQADRTAWKLMRDWVEIQISLIHLKQVEFLQVFLPYVIASADGRTYYETLRESGFKALLPDKT